jgi:hypothetical protein
MTIAPTLRSSARAKTSSVQPGAVEDEVDHVIAVPGLQQPLLRRALRAHADADKGFESALCVLGLEHEIEIARDGGAAARPARQAAAEHERHAFTLQRRCRLLQRG